MQKFFVRIGNRTIKRLEKEQGQKLNIILPLVISPDAGFKRKLKRIITIQKFEYMDAKDELPVIYEIGQLPRNGLIIRISGFWYISGRGGKVRQNIQIYRGIGENSSAFLVVERAVI